MSFETTGDHVTNRYPSDKPNTHSPDLGSQNKRKEGKANGIVD
ncbi:hypothetical protein [Bacillus mycoides]|nr:hypothetical protein [Bacillus mycoides]